MLDSWRNDPIARQSAHSKYTPDWGKQNQPINLTGAWREKENTNDGADASEVRVPPAAVAAVRIAFLTRGMGENRVSGGLAIWCSPLNNVEVGLYETNKTNSGQLAHQIL